LRICVLFFNIKAFVLCFQTKINDLNRDGEQGRYGHIIDDTKMQLASIVDWQANHVRRTLNTAAHGLAKVASKAVMDKVWRDVVLKCICDIVPVEQIIST
jgi:hypothetical protein